MTTTDYSDLAGTKALAQSLAHMTRITTHVLHQDGRYLIQDDADIFVYGGRAAIVASFDPPLDPLPDAGRTEAMNARRREIEQLSMRELRARYIARTGDTKPPRKWMAGDYVEMEVLAALNTYMAREVDPPPPPFEDPLPDPGPEGPGVPGDERPRAVTRQSIAIDQASQRNRICKNPDCQGAHFTWQCPDIRTALFAPTELVYDTNELVQLWATSRTLLAAKLARLTRAQLHMQAIAFAAWLDTRTRANLSAASVLHIWETFILAGGDPAQQKAAA